jgi:aldehyde:ferredoxin oxidoreductase
MALHGYGRILDVNLSTGSIRKTEIDPVLAEGYIGGMGFGCKILYDQVGTDVDPLGPNHIRQGLTRKDDAWPDQFFEEPLPEGPAQGRVVTREEIQQVLDEYYELRGWEKSSGLPTEKTLNELGFHDIAAELKALGKLPLNIYN